MHPLANEKGVTVIAAVATLMVLSLMGTVVVSLVGIENYSALHQAQSLEAQWIAEAGVQRTLTYMSRENGTCPPPNPTPPPACPTLFSTVTLGRGTFTVEACRYNPSPTAINKSGGINATATIIPVDSLTGFAPRGRIAIEAEFIGYTGTGTTAGQCPGETPPCFTGAKRGMDDPTGTTAAAHADNTPVSQYQCTISSTGTVSAGVGDAKRVVEVVVQ